MAQNIGEAQINLSVNTSQMEREVSAALKRLESKGFNLGQGINARAFTQPLGRITGAANEFQKSLDASNARVIAFGASAGAIYNVQRAFSSLITSTIEVQKSLTDINVILGASNKTLGQFSDQLFQIARNSGQTFATVATAAGELARQGLSLEQTLKRTSDALVLARLSGLDAASSVEALTASINSFNNAALDSSQIVNKLASVDAAFAVSSADLAEALKRVGSSAQDVGVSFDELLAIVASVNQTTARGGAVIGNSLKTIFTRVQRTDVLNQLEALGVAVRDLQGNTAPAIQILSGLAQKFDQLGDAQKSQVAELVGGVFQINILKAALGDLSREYSIYGNALKISSSATDEAVRRNEELNKTLAALLNRTVANLTKVASEIGGVSIQPAIEKVLGGLNTALESFDIKGDSIGSKIGKGIFEGIGSFISGPGLALLIGVFGKIFLNLTKFTTDAVRTLLGINKEAQAQAQIQERINNILAQNPQLVQNILNKQVSLLQVEKDILTIIQAQTRAREQSTAIAATVSRSLISRGATVSEKGTINTSRTKSQGFVPNFNANKEIMGAISGGYMPGQIRSMNIPNYGRVTYNTAEEIKRFPGLSQPGIMPPEDSEAGRNYKQKFKDKYGINPYASKGFIPNFAASLNRIVTKGAQPISGDMYDVLRKSPAFADQVYGSSRGGYFLRPTANKDQALIYYKQQTERSVLARGKGELNQEEIEKTGAVLVYPAFSGGGLSSTTAKALKHSGKRGDDTPEFTFSTFGFPGPNGGLGAQLYEDVQKAIKGQVYTFIDKAALKPKDLVDDARFDNYVNANLNRSTIEAAIGGIFEAGLKSAIFSAVDDPNAPLDLSSDELKKLSTTFKGAGPLAMFSLGEVKNALNPSQAASMADKIASTRGYPLKTAKMKKAFGFIPNFSPLEKALKTEQMMGGAGVLDYKQGLGLYVRDGKTQPNFAAVMRDHPEGIQKATKNSKIMQEMASNGFIPNFAGLGFDPMTLYFMASQFFQGNPQSKENLKVAETRLGEILNERGKTEAEILTEQKKSNPSRKKLADLDKQLASIKESEINQRSIISREMPVFARKGGGFVGGFGGVVSRAAGRYGPGLALAAPLATGAISQFVGDDVTREGRGQKAIVSGLGQVASFAGLGFMLGGPLGAGIGAGVGGVTAAIDVYSKFNDMMPELANAAQNAQEKLNTVNSSTQALSTSLETLSSVQNNTDLSNQERVRLQIKASEDFADALSKLEQVIPGASREIQDLYRKVGNTAELRSKISELQDKAQKDSQAIISAKNAVSASKAAESLIEPGFFENILRLSPNIDKGDLEKANRKSLDFAKSNQFNQNITDLSNSLTGLFSNLSKTGEKLKSSDLERLISAYNTGGLPALQKVLESLVKGQPEVEYIQNILSQINPLIFQEAIKQALKTQQGAEAALALLKQEEAAIKAGTRDINNLDSLIRQFSMIGEKGQLTPFDPTRKVDWNAIFGPNTPESNAALKGFGDEFKNIITNVNKELGATPNKLSILNGLYLEAGKIQQEFAKGSISASEALRRLKLAADEIDFNQNGRFMFSDERSDALQKMLGERLRGEDFAKGLRPGQSFFTALGDDAKTTAKKINESFANLANNIETGIEDAFGAFVDGSKTAEDAFRDMMLNISQQIIKEQFSIGMRSLLGGLTGGGGFGGNTDNGGGLLGGFFKGLFGGFSRGGLVKGYSSGGYVNQGSGYKDDVPAMLSEGEYVLRKSAVDKYGLGMLHKLNSGGLVKGYATGGRINTLLPNRYDFYGANGELLTNTYTPEAFKTTVTSPEELSKVPALSGRFNISDLLSSRAMMNEDNPMVALRNQRFLGMQNYQEQVSSFKTSYNEQMRQVEEARREAQKQADEINAQRMAQYNARVSQGFIGGLIGAGFSLFGGLASSNMLGGLGSFFGGGGGGLGAATTSGNFFQQLFGGGEGLNFFKGLAQTAAGNIGANAGISGGTVGGLNKDQMDQISDRIEMGQLTGYKDPFFGSQTTKGGLYSSQAGQGSASFFPFTPASTVGGFMYNVGLGTPAGFQTRTQTNQDLYNVMSASSVGPIGGAAVARGMLTTDQYRLQLLQTAFSDQFGGYAGSKTNPFGYAQGGMVTSIANKIKTPETFPMKFDSGVIKSVMGSEGAKAIQGGVEEYFGFRRSTSPREFTAIGRAISKYGAQSPIVEDVVGSFLIRNATQAGAFKFSNASTQASMLSLAHMRGVGGAQAIFNSVAGAPMKYSGSLSKAAISKIEKMDPILFQSLLKQKRIEYDKTFYGNKTDSVTRNGKTITGKWWDLFGKGLTKRYEKEQEYFTGLSYPEFKNFAKKIQQGTPYTGLIPNDDTINAIMQNQLKYASTIAANDQGRVSDTAISIEAQAIARQNAKEDVNYVPSWVPADQKQAYLDYIRNPTRIPMYGSKVQGIDNPFAFDMKKLEAAGIPLGRNRNPTAIGRKYFDEKLRPNLQAQMAEKSGPKPTMAGILSGNLGAYGAGAVGVGAGAVGIAGGVKYLGSKGLLPNLGGLDRSAISYQGARLGGMRGVGQVIAARSAARAAATISDPVLEQISYANRIGASTAARGIPAGIATATPAASASTLGKTLMTPAARASFLAGPIIAYGEAMMSGTTSPVRALSAKELEAMMIPQGTPPEIEEMIRRNLPRTTNLGPNGPRPYKPGGLPSGQKLTTPTQPIQPIQNQRMSTPQEVQEIVNDIIEISESRGNDSLGSLYSNVGVLMDMEQRSKQESYLASKFAPFYSNQPLSQRLLPGSKAADFIGKSNYGQYGFNNYLQYVGFKGQSLSDLLSFKFPLTPNTYSPFAFSSRYFGGFGGTGYQSGFNSLGVPFSNWFSAGSRLGIKPDWQARATGGMIYGGTSYKDDVPAMLMGGEYVIRKDVVDRMGKPFFDSLNRGSLKGYADGGPVGTSLPSVGTGLNQGEGNDSDSKKQFVDALTKLLKSLDQLNRSVEDQTREMKDQATTTDSISQTQEGTGGVTNNINISVNVDQNGQTSGEKQDQNQDSEGNDMTDQEKFKKTLERSRMLAELLRQQILKVITEEQRPGGVLYQGSKGRDLGR
ncbi:MAG: phage tail tape measure protein [Proteobacteria bacterium]|nr:phage tail tape measure protein [Pseudomonadota bacterium]